jgi:VanZ family protein
LSTSPPGSGRRWSVRTVLPFVVFLFFLGLWTWELLAENPVPDSVRRAIPNGWHFYLAKGLHVGAYAFLTVLAGLLPVGRWFFWGAIAALLLHGIAGEVGQTFVPGRTGSVRDVLLDWAGIGLGLVALGLARWVGRRFRRTARG